MNTLTFHGRLSPIPEKTSARPRGALDCSDMRGFPDTPQTHDPDLHPPNPDKLHLILGKTLSREQIPSSRVAFGPKQSPTRLPGPSPPSDGAIAGWARSCQGGVARGHKGDRVGWGGGDRPAEREERRQFGRTGSARFDSVRLRGLLRRKTAQSLLGSTPAGRKRLPGEPGAGLHPSGWAGPAGLLPAPAVGGGPRRASAAA